MEFKENRPIYLQIVSYVSDKITSGEWQEEERIPSVRELGGELGVNPNTCMRAYEHLTRQSVIANARGIGYSVMRGAKNRLLELSREEFYNEIFPEIIERMQKLGISKEEIIAKLERE